MILQIANTWELAEGLGYPHTDLVGALISLEAEDMVKSQLLQTTYFIVSSEGQGVRSPVSWITRYFRLPLLSTCTVCSYAIKSCVGFRDVLGRSERRGCFRFVPLPPVRKSRAYPGMLPETRISFPRAKGDRQGLTGDEGPGVRTRWQPGHQQGRPRSRLGERSCQGAMLLACRALI